MISLLTQVQAFEQLISTKIFAPVAAAGAAANMNREFVKYRCVPEREAVKAAVDKSGQTNLKKWLGKAQ
jgi:origin recognition complex subunit 4